MSGVARRRLNPTPTRPSRTRLLAPFAMLGLLWLAASAFWLYASTRTHAEIDAWLAREAAAGRDWSCAKREIGGYPFRIEFTCAEAAFRGAAQGRAVSGSLGKAVAVAQVYSPRLLIVEAEGPLIASSPDGGRLQATWSSLRASLSGEPGVTLERLSIEGEGVSVALSGPLAPDMTATAASARLHLRPTPAAPAQAGSYDIALSLDKAAAPGLSAIFASPSIDIDALARLTEARPFAAASLPAELARWQEAGGRLRLTRLRAGTPERELEATGELALDGEGRPQGRIDLTVTGLDGLARTLVGGRGEGSGAGALIGALVGRPKDNSAPAKPIALPLKLDHGRVMLGPLPIATLPPLF